MNFNFILDLKNIGFLFLLVGVLSLFLHFLIELCSIFKIKKWLKKNKDCLLVDEDINNKYLNEVLNSEDYNKLKEIYDDAPFLLKHMVFVGLNYLDYIFFQNLIVFYFSKNDDSFFQSLEFKRLRKILSIMFSMKISNFLRGCGLFCVKFTVVYFIVLFLYDKIF